jgi:hypothetical protein
MKLITLMNINVYHVLALILHKDHKNFVLHIVVHLALKYVNQINIPLFPKMLVDVMSFPVLISHVIKTVTPWVMVLLNFVPVVKLLIKKTLLAHTIKVFNLGLVTKSPNQLKVLACVTTKNVNAHPNADLYQMLKNFAVELTVLSTLI